MAHTLDVHQATDTKHDDVGDTDVQYAAQQLLCLGNVRGVVVVWVVGDDLLPHIFFFQFCEGEAPAWQGRRAVNTGQSTHYGTIPASSQRTEPTAKPGTAPLACTHRVTHFNARTSDTRLPAVHPPTLLL